MKRLSVDPRPRHLTTIALLALAGVTCAREYKVNVIDLGSGYTIQGMVSTNGKTGLLAPSDFIGWTLTVTETSQDLYTPLNTRDQSSQLFVEGGLLKIPTSPDGFLAGGALRVYGHSHLFASPVDCSGAFASGGQSYYCYGADFDYLPLGLPNESVHAVGKLRSANQFDLFPVNYGYGTTMFGTVSTTNAAGPVQLVDWSITVRHENSKVYTRANSQIVESTAVFATQKDLRVLPHDSASNPGRLVMGRPGSNPTLVILADFSVSSPYAVAAYIDPFVYQVSSPLQLDPFGNRIVAQVPRLGIRPKN
ncbi:MAG: hypothetical protein JSS66_17455 [Armatimonadetes bacterium]|nr:hypothetical protein [Armatimonadota bacterium]